MKIFFSFFFHYSFVIIHLSFLFFSCQSETTTDEPEGNIAYSPSTEAFANPMKGFRKTRYLLESGYPSGEYLSTVQHMIRYTDLEQNESDTAQKIKDWSNIQWASLPQRNIKVIPRVVILYPDGPDGGEYWPQGLGAGTLADKWTSTAFKQRIAKFIEKLGEAWDDDPRVAAIEAGIWGKWGEHHIWPESINGNDRIPIDVQKAMGDAFTKAFKNKKVMVRYPKEFTNFNFGFYWDSFALPEDNNDSGQGIINRNCWRTQMISGEVAYDWGSQNIVGGTPDGTLRSAKITNYIIEWIGKVHASSLGWISNYTQSDPVIAANAAKIQKAFGYRYVVKNAVFERQLKSGENFSFEFTVENTGCAPFYYRWPVELSLLDSNKIPVWTSIVDADIHTWLPGKVYKAGGEFAIPHDFEQGTYTLALAVLDPAGNLPSLRFANVNYYKGGRMPLGKVGVDMAPDTDDLGPFDSLYSDRSLQYKIVNSN